MANGDDPGDETAFLDRFAVEALRTGTVVLTHIKNKTAELCPVCGVAWGFPCGRTNCGLNETKQ